MPPRVPCEAGKSAVGSRYDATRVADRGRYPLQAIGYHLRMLDVVSRRVDYASDQLHAVREGIASEAFVLMCMAGVGHLHISPAHMQTNMLRINALKSVVDGVDHHLRPAQVLSQGEVAKRPAPVRDQIRCIDLREQTARDDRVVFDRQRPSKGMER